MTVTQREAVVLATIVALYSLPALAQQTSPTPVPVFWAQDQSDQSSHIYKALDEPLATAGFEFHGVPLSEVVDFIRNEYSIEVQLDLQALDDLGLSPDDPIDVNVRNISLGSALKIMLRPLDLTYVVADEVLLITSDDEALTRLTVAVYPVGDLLAPKSAPGRDAAAATGNEEESEPPKPESIDTLIDVITATVATDTWAQNGGPEADICAIQPGLLVISQTQDVHEQIADLLAALRAARQHEFAINFPGDPCTTLRKRLEDAEAALAYLRRENVRRRSQPEESEPTIDHGGGGAF